MLSTGLEAVVSGIVVLSGIEVSVDGVLIEVSTVFESVVPSAFLSDPHPTMAIPAIARTVKNLNFIVSRLNVYNQLFI